MADRSLSWRRLALLLLGWLVLTLLLAAVLFFHSSRTVVVASHETRVSPTLSGYVVVDTGAVLPDLRLPTHRVLGVDLDLGKTQASSAEALVDRYAFIASHPEGQIALVTSAVQGLAVSALLRGAVLAAVPFVLWELLGSRRRRELAAGLRTRRGAAAVAGTTVLAVVLVQPWHWFGERLQGPGWMPLESVTETRIAGLGDVEITSDATTDEAKRLIDSAIDTYRKSKIFYATAQAEAADLDVRHARNDETVVVLVSDRHDNIGMDPVARAIGDAAGATAVFDAGDDTSQGSTWEAFSLDSLNEAFSDLDRFGIAGNHDSGDFVHGYLADLGWTMLDGQTVAGPGSTLLWGIDDPRSSGLGNWRDATGASFSEVEQNVADDVCAADDRITTLLVHDANLGREALKRGCVDLVLAGHLHVVKGPTRVVGENGQVGYTFTNGTTGGAAYAIAVGSEPKRPATVSLVTYRDGRPAGIQAVTLETDGTWLVGPWVPLEY